MSRIIDPFDELAQLFLTDGDDEPAPSRHVRHDDNGAATTALTPIELLLVGHLPVRADLWLRPYAAAISRDVGAVALVRLDSDEPSVEVLGGNGSVLAEGDDRSLRQTIGELVPVIDLWIVRPSGQTPAAALVQADGARITIISSADEAALVAAYLRIKDLADAARDAECDVPQLGVAILGSPEPVARSMVDRLNRTTRTFLGIELPLITTLRQMEAGSRSQAYARFLGERSPSVDDVIGWLHDANAAPVAMLPVPEARQTPIEELRFNAASREELDEPQDDAEPWREISDQSEAAPLKFELRTQREESDQATEVPAPPREPVVHVEERADAVAGDRDVLELLRQARPAAFETQREQQRGAANTAGAVSWKSVKVPPKPALLREPKAAEQSREPGAGGAAQALAAFVAGLTSIAVRCPGHERIELALDGDGRFHLLCREDAMRELHLVEAWTCSHRELLAMALHGLRLDASAKPVLHVFTEAPVTLADLHGSSLHLHVLAPVVVEGKTGWYAAPLNAPA
jgi:hypothetical protein